MKQKVTEKCVHNIHPVYNLYAASEDAKIIHIVKQKPFIGDKTHSGYILTTVRKHGEKLQNISSSPICFGMF